jgi:hydroxymethylbilane synthase
MGGSCRTPLAAKGTVNKDMVRLRALVASPDGKRVIRGEHQGNVKDADYIGMFLADSLLAQGGREILERLEATGVRL